MRIINSPHASGQTERTIEVKYGREIIQVWQDDLTGKWRCCIATPGHRTCGEEPLRGIGPDQDFDSPEAAVDAAMVMVDDDD
jgi:hypothetical protein